MASFGPITANWGGNVAGLPKPGAVPKPPSGIAAAGTGLLKGLAPAKPKPVKLATGISAAGSAATNLAGQLTQGGPTAAATGGGNAPGPTGGADQPDSTAQQNIANYLFKTNNSINSDTQKIGNYQTDLTNVLGQLAYEQPRDALSLEQKANAGGGLYSSVEQQNQGNLAQKFLTEQTNDTTKYDQMIQGLQGIISGLQQSIPIYNSGQYADSAQRASAAAQAAQVAAPAATAAAAPAPVALNPGVSQAGRAVAGPLAKALSQPAKPKPAAKNKNLGLFGNLLK